MKSQAETKDKMKQSQPGGFDEAKEAFVEGKEKEPVQAKDASSLSDLGPFRPAAFLPDLTFSGKLT